MDSNEFNKIAGAVIGSLLVFVLLGFFASLVFHGGEGGHGGDETLAFALDTGEEEADAAEAEPEAPVDLAALVAAADAGAGEKLYSQCRACHRIEDGANAVGPHLWNVVGRDIAAVPGFGYSDALMAKDGAWDLENLLGFLEKPSDWAPGTIMGYAGLRKIEDRVNLIAYLNQAGDAPVDLAAMVPADTGASTGEAATDEAATDEAVTEDAATDVAATEEAATEEAATEEAVTEEAGTDEAATEEAVTEEAVTEEAATEETATETAGTDEAATEEAVTEEAVTEETATETAATEEAASEEAATEEAATETAAVDSAFAPLLAAASAETGQKVFRKCQACHKVEDGKNGVGPHLWGVVGREIASVEGYSYSDALTGKDGVWDLETLDAFLAAPRSWAPGTKMAFAGLRDPQERVDVITYLNEASGSPVELAAAAPAAATAPEATEAAPEPEATEAETAEAEAETAEATGTETAEAAPEPEATEAETAEAAPEAEATEAETAEAAPEPEATGTETAEANAEPEATEAETAEAAPEPEATEAETAEAAPEPEATGTETAETAAEPETMEVAAVDPAAPAETGETSEAGTYAALLASADADAGETLFRQCRACHKVEEGWSGVGPTLHGVVGRPIGSVEGYRYSTAFQALEGDWTLDRLMAYLENPRAWVPGTKMIYSGLRDAQDRIDLITFLNQADGSPVALE